MPQKQGLMETFGDLIVERVLLSQYSGAENLQTYIKAFTDEYNELYKAIQEVYWGVQLDYADGVQLDRIGRIIGQSRRISLSRVYFGFEGSTNSETFGDENNAATGGFFRSETDQGQSQELGDLEYRNLLRARAYSATAKGTPDDIRNVCNLVFGSTLETLVIDASDMEATVWVNPEEISLEVMNLAYYAMSNYTVPSGVQITFDDIINRP